MLTVSQQKQSVVEFVGAVGQEIRQLVADNIDDIWCVALNYGCSYPLTVLYAQREAIDFALAWLTPRVNQKLGDTDAFRTTEGKTDATSQARSNSRGQGWSCDWSNTASFANNRTNGDSWSRSRSASDHQSSTFYFSHSWDRSRRREDSASQSAYGRSSETARTNESQHFSEHSNRVASQSVGGLHVGAPFFSSLPITPLSVKIKVPPLDIVINTPFGPITVGSGAWINASLVDISPPFEGSAVSTCAGAGVGCPTATLQVVPPPSREEADNVSFGFPSFCLSPSYSASNEVSLNVAVPIPFVGSLNFSATWAAGAEQRPRCMSSRTDAQSSSLSNARTWMRAKMRGGGSSLSDSVGTQQNDAHTRANGAGNSDGLSRTVGRSYSIVVGESHSGSNTDSHGESQASDINNTRSSSRGRGYQITSSDKRHIFDIRRYSDMFTALNDLRAKIVVQIEESLRAVSQLYGKGKVRDVRKIKPISPYALSRGAAASNSLCNAYCFAPTRARQPIIQPCFASNTV